MRIPRRNPLNSTTPLHTAAAKPQGYRSVRLLLDAGADPNAPRSLFPAGVNVPISDPAFGEIRPLALAIYYGDLALRGLLLKRGASPGEPWASPPVAAAAFTGQGDWVRELVRRGGEVNFDEGFVGHAFNNLMYSGHRRDAGFVLDHGADLHRSPPLARRRRRWFGRPIRRPVMPPRPALLAKGVDINESTLSGQ